MLAARARALLIGLALAIFDPGTRAFAQVTFSIDWRGPTIGDPASVSGIPIRESDVLQPPIGAPGFGVLANPRILFNGGQLGLNQYAHCGSIPPNTPCRVEVDALSYAKEAKFTNMSFVGKEPGFAPSRLFPPLPPRPRLWFSVDGYAVGTVIAIAPPNPQSEGGTVGDSPADVFTAFDIPTGPLPPGALADASVGVFDGNGRFSLSGYVYPGIGLEEPNFPGPPLGDEGDNLDALNIGTLPGSGEFAYFSLDAGFVDPVLGVPNSGSAALAGVPPGAVLQSPLVGTTPTIYATPAQLGLDLFGANTDDLDALILSENGIPGFQPSVTPYDWLSGSTDMVIFSIRRGSRLDVNAVPDSIFGLPIEPGDLLTTPPAPGMPPGIFIAAENLGLETRRQTPAAVWGDELDAATLTSANCYDCNSNGVEDAVDIANGTSGDGNNNGIPDECESAYSVYCTCPLPVAPCSNPDASAGCENSTGVGGELVASGTTSVFTDDLVLTATQLPPNATGFALRAKTLTQFAFNDGNLCIGPAFFRSGLTFADSSGTATRGPGLVTGTCWNVNSVGCLMAGVTWHFQFFYRDLSGPCGTGSNLTNGVSVTFTP